MRIENENEYKTCAEKDHSSMSYCKTVEKMIAMAKKNYAQEMAINCRIKFCFSAALRTSN